MFLKNSEIVMLGVAGILLTLGMGISFNVNVGMIHAQETATNSGNEIVDNFTDVVVPDASETNELPGEPAVVATTTDLFLTEINATIGAISALVGSAIGIIVFVANTIRSRTGQKYISNEVYSQLTNVAGIVEEKSSQLRDSHRQVMEMRETINAVVAGLKAFNPEAASKLDNALTVANQTMNERIQPQVGAWQIEQDRFFDTLKKNIEVLKA